jgi:hypothetical protein
LVILGNDVGALFSYHNARRVGVATNIRRKHTITFKLESTTLPIAQAKIFFTEYRVRERTREIKLLAYESCHPYRHLFREESKAEWVMLPKDEKDFWESTSRSKAGRQPQIRDNIIECLRGNPSKCFEKVAADIACWANGWTIQKWFARHGGVMYAQRALPLLTAVQRDKHVKFCKHLLNNWGMPTRRKILWIHYDEKWFYGWGCRANAKKCEALGLEKTHTYLYHKCHIEKVLCVAFTGYAFDKSVENGGKGVKLGFYRVQGARIAKRTVKKSRKTEDGCTKYDGVAIREMGDAYLIDCNVTGSNEGTSDAPKFSLLSLFCDHVFPKVLELVSNGGEFDGYLPGPHIDATYHDFVNDYCESKGWHWESQAPQMPHMNNLDLAVFSKMLKDHSSLLQNYSNKMAPAHEIWCTAQAVWRNMDSACIARVFILAYRITQKVIDNAGTNTFLQTHNPRTSSDCAVRSTMSSWCSHQYAAKIPRQYTHPELSLH